MAEYLDNPAGRLRDLLVKLQALAGNNAFAGWQVVLESSNEANNSVFWSRFAAVVALPQKVREAVAAAALIGADDSAALLEPMDAIEAAFARSGSMAGLGMAQFLEGIGADAMYMLANFSASLHKVSAEKPLANIEIWIDDIRILIDEVSSAEDLTVEDKAELTARLRDIEEAFLTIRIRGNGHVTTTVQTLIGAIGTQPQFAANVGNSKSGHKVRTFLVALALGLDLAASSTQIAANSMQMLDSGPSSVSVPLQHAPLVAPAETSEPQSPEPTGDEPSAVP